MADPSVDVTVEPRSSKQFSKDEEVTVVITGGEGFWVTVLGSKPPVGVGSESQPPDGKHHVG